MCLLGAAAQSPETAGGSTDSLRYRPQFKLSLNYNSNLHFYGRTDSIRSSGYFPMAELWVTPKFYVNAAPIFVNNRLQSFDYAGTVATVGYLDVSEKWIKNLSVLKPFYEQEARLVQSALKAQGGASVSRLGKVLNVTLGADAKFSDRVDFGALAAIDHPQRFPFRNNSVLVIDPSLTVHAGTQRFSRTYTRRKEGVGGGLLPLPGPGRGQTETVTEPANRFGLLAVEASLPLVYVKESWMLLLTPSWVLPQNLLPGETGKNLFAVTAGVKWTW